MPESEITSIPEGIISQLFYDFGIHAKYTKLFKLILSEAVGIFGSYKNKLAETGQEIGSDKLEEELDRVIDQLLADYTDYPAGDALKSQTLTDRFKRAINRYFSFYVLKNYLNSRD